MRVDAGKQRSWRICVGVAIVVRFRFVWSGDGVCSQLFEDLLDVIKAENGVGPIKYLACSDPADMRRSRVEMQPR